jgi:hypothetical protein
MMVIKRNNNSRNFPGKMITLTFLAAFVISCAESTVGTDFKAYYTCYGAGSKITGDYADVVIRFPDQKRFVFSGESSYLPFLELGGKKWYVNEIIERKGDGEGLRQDKDNIYSYARIIKNDEDEILVHWRYIPDFSNPSFSGVVHEYFSVKPDGRVTRTIQPGREKLDEFNDPDNWFVEELALGHSGIKQVSFRAPDPGEEALESVGGSPVIEGSVVTAPVLRWAFDEGMNDRPFRDKDVTVTANDSVRCSIGGGFSLWKKGVSGTALAFDGYYSKVTLANAEPPREPSPFTLEAWVALGAYPWMEGAVMDITENDQGVYLGISDLGQLIFRIHGEKEPHTVTSVKEIGLYKWTHVAATYNKDLNKAAIYINGEEAGKLSLGDDRPILVPTKIVIGLNKKPERTTQHVSRDYPPDVRTPEGNQPMVYGIEGLIDEARIYIEPLSGEQIRKSYSLLSQDRQLLANPDLEPRILPGEVDGENADRFGACYTSLKYHDLWDNLWRSGPWPDVVVRFDQLPCNVVYWRGSNFGPGWVTEKNIWMSDQSAEIGTYYGCAEHMADKQNRFSHVRILENTDARVVIHWRYASADIMYLFDNWRTWTDEYHYIYPDGTAVRHVNYYDGEVGWQDVQFFAQPGTTPEDQINLKALTVANLEGETFKMDWTDGIPENKLEDASISVVNFKSGYKVMVIYPDGSEIGAWGEQERATPETHFAGPWNHWPVSQMPNDGRYAMRTDRVTHSALGGAGPETMAIYGFTNQDIATLLPLARFWNHPPEMKALSGAKGISYEQSQKAYILEATGGEISLSVEASESSPLQNPCLVIRNCRPEEIRISMNDASLAEGTDFRYGFVPVEGGYDLVIWIRTTTDQTANIHINEKI